MVTTASALSQTASARLRLRNEFIRTGHRSGLRAISIGLRVNDLIKTKVKVSATTLDTLIKELAPNPPFLLKLDIQGAEMAALVGARDVLENCNVVICEADIDDFQDVNKILSEAGFGLYDITQLSRIQDGTLGWFYPVYISSKLDDVRPRSFWDAKENDAVIGLQVERRIKI